MCNITPDFAATHIRIIGPRQHNDRYSRLIERATVSTQGLDQAIPDDKVLQQAKALLQARHPRPDGNPDTVMYMTIQTLDQLCAQLGTCSPNQEDVPFEIRIPYIVTMNKEKKFELYDNASGFRYDGNAAGHCSEFSGPDNDSLTRVDYPV
ncbi:hypothetical protein [Pseudomonas aegrilactucae]|uniref:Uncharacterized protein n=1 Tax=Pseudomonas aegrilactucae TaxID=2854028 RepID=A0A9Q2XHE5_9PSED|nr:hypothetical protein [Pseudomonas aegrilactucae]MBV6286212.1 hypothetical protein [Pseudomonas aegrilactucae]